MKFISGDQVEYQDCYNGDTWLQGIYKLEDEKGNVVVLGFDNELTMIAKCYVRKIPKMISLDEMIKYCYNTAEEDGRLWANQYQIFQEAIKLMKNYNMFKEGVEFLDPRESND